MAISDMIFTVGHAASYREGLAEAKITGVRLKKLGYRASYRYSNSKIGPYLGGIVFKTREEAISWIEKNNHPDFDVFGLDIHWDGGTHFVDGQHYLINDSEIKEIK